MSKNRKQGGCSNDDYVIESIQEAYRALYQNVYDLEAKVDKYIDLSEIKNPFLNPEFSKEEDQIMSLLMFDSIIQWRFAETESSVHSTQRGNSLAHIFRPMAHIMERYQFYLTQSVPLGSVGYQRHHMKERRIQINEELMKIDTQRHLQITRQAQFANPIEAELPMKVVEKAWLRERRLRKAEFENALHIQRDLDLTQISLLLNHFKNGIMSVLHVIGRLVYEDAYYQALLNSEEQTGTINPLSAIADRFHLKNEDIYDELVSNNVRWLRTFMEMRENFDANLEPQRFLDEEMRLKMMHNRMEALNVKLQPAPHQVQQFYLNQRYRGVIDIPPQTNMTLYDAVIFEPNALQQKYNDPLAKRLKQLKIEHLISNIDQKAMPMTMFLKNNFTHLEKIELTGTASTSFLEVVDVKKELWFSADNPYQLISVGNSSQALLKVLQDIVEPQSPEPLDLYGFEDMQNLDQRLKRQVEMRQILKGSDYHVLNSLFGDFASRYDYPESDMYSHIVFPTKKAYRNPFVFEEDAEQQSSRLDPDKLDPVKDKEFISHFKDLNTAKQAAEAASRVYRDKGFSYSTLFDDFQIRQRELDFSGTLKSQNFQNYAVINLPISDIFRAPIKERRQDEPVQISELIDVDAHDDELGESCQASDASIASIYRESLFLMDDEWHNQVNAKSPRDQMHVLQEQRRKRAKFKEKPHLRQIVAQGLGIWDRQDLRVDINWTNFQTRFKKNEVSLVRTHRRVLMLQNTGILPFNLRDIKVDDVSCGAQNSMLVLNCQELKREFGPSTNISIELQIEENFRFAKKQRFIEIESDYFTQHFTVDIIIPEKAINLVSAYEQQVNRNDSRFFTMVALIGNCVFLVAMLYFLCFVSTVLKIEHETHAMSLERSAFGSKFDFGCNEAFGLSTEQKDTLTKYKKINHHYTDRIGQMRFEITHGGITSIGKTNDQKHNNSMPDEEFNQLCQAAIVRSVIPSPQDSKLEIVKNFQQATDRYNQNPDEYRRNLVKKGQFIASELKNAKDIAEERLAKQKEVLDKTKDAFTQLIDGLEWSEPYSDQIKLQADIQRALDSIPMPVRDDMGVKFRKVGNNALKFALVSIDEHDEAERISKRVVEQRMEVPKPKVKKETEVNIEDLQSTQNLTKKQRKQLIAATKVAAKQAERMRLEQANAHKVIQKVQPKSLEVEEQEHQHEVVQDQEQEVQNEQGEEVERITAPKKKIPKGLSRKEQKEKEKRLKREAELIENAKRQEALASKMKQLEEQKLQLEREKKEEAQKESQRKKDESQSDEKSIEVKSEKSEKVYVAQPLNPMDKYDFEIQSYHSSQDNRKQKVKNKKKPISPESSDEREEIINPQDTCLSEQNFSDNELQGSIENSQEVIREKSEDMHISQEPEPESQDSLDSRENRESDMEETKEQEDKDSLHASDIQFEQRHFIEKSRKPRGWDEKHAEWQEPSKIKPYNRQQKQHPEWENPRQIESYQPHHRKDQQQQWVAKTQSKRDYESYDKDHYSKQKKSYRFDYQYQDQYEDEQIDTNPVYHDRRYERQGYRGGPNKLGFQQSKDSYYENKYQSYSNYEDEYREPAYHYNSRYDQRKYENNRHYENYRNPDQREYYAKPGYSRDRDYPYHSGYQRVSKGNNPRTYKDQYRERDRQDYDDTYYDYKESSYYQNKWNDEDDDYIPHEGERAEEKYATYEEPVKKGRPMTREKVKSIPEKVAPPQVSKKSQLQLEKKARKVVPKIKEEPKMTYVVKQKPDKIKTQEKYQFTEKVQPAVDVIKSQIWSEICKGDKEESLKTTDQKKQESSEERQEVVDTMEDERVPMMEKKPQKKKTTMEQFRGISSIFSNPMFNFGSQQSDVSSEAGSHKSQEEFKSVPTEQDDGKESPYFQRLNDKPQDNAFEQPHEYSIFNKNPSMFKGFDEASPSSMGYQLEQQMFAAQGNLGLGQRMTSEPLSPDVAGLSHSSFVNLRRRAFDSGREGLEPKDNEKNFMGALKMPKFMQENKNYAMSLIGPALEESSEEDDEPKIHFQRAFTKK